MERFKYCCGGLKAYMIQPLFPVKIKDTIWYTAMYVCSKCGQISIRGECNKPDHNTMVRLVEGMDQNTVIDELKLKEILIHG